MKRTGRRRRIRRPAAGRPASRPRPRSSGERRPRGGDVCQRTGTTCGAAGRSPASVRAHVDSAAVTDSWTGVRYLTADELRNVHSVDEFEPLAQARMDPTCYAYIAGWAGTGATHTANRRAFWRYVLRPRALTDVQEVDTRTTVLGQPVQMPVLFAPSGYQALAHPEGELATARASVRVGTTMILSTSSNYSIEQVAPLAHDPWYQLYW